MKCTSCGKPILRGQKYHRTKRGPHHADCMASFTRQEQRNALGGEIMMLRARNKQLVFQEQQQRAISNNLRAELAKTQGLRAALEDELHALELWRAVSCLPAHLEAATGISIDKITRALAKDK